MLMRECHPLDEIFSHEDLEGVTRHFNATAMTRAVLNATLTPTFSNLALYEDLVNHIKSHHGVEPDHLQHVDKHIDNPILLVEFADQTNLVVDGNHRIVKRWMLGKMDVDAAIFKPGQWEPFLVTDMHLPREMYANIEETT